MELTEKETVTGAGHIANHRGRDRSYPHCEQDARLGRDQHSHCRARGGAVEAAARNGVQDRAAALRRGLFHRRLWRRLDAIQSLRGKPEGVIGYELA